MSDSRDSSRGERVRNEYIEERRDDYADRIQRAIEVGNKKVVDRDWDAAAYCALDAYYRTCKLTGSVFLRPPDEYVQPVNERFSEIESSGVLYRLTVYFRDVCHDEGIELGVDADPLDVIQDRPDLVRWAVGEVKGDRALSTQTTDLDGWVAAFEFIEKFAMTVGVIGAPGEDVYVMGEDFEDSWLHETYQKRDRQGRSLAAVIVARDNATGTGKTTLAVSLAKKWAGDWDASEFATNRSWEYRRMVRDAPQGSVLLADEIGTMFDSRRSMSNSNVEASHDWQMLRFRELTTLATLPGVSYLDKRLRQLADVLIIATRRGHGRVYRLKVDDGSGNTFMEHKCNVEWGALDDDPDYQYVEEMKEARFEERFADEDEAPVAEEEIDEARREGRNDTIRELVEAGLTQTEIAEALDMDQSTVSRIVNE